jgi:hypothetical protein
VAGLWKLPAGATDPAAFKRQGVRRVYRENATASAADLIGPLAPGDDLCGLTNGQFSLVDIVEHVLSQTGPADLCIATWTQGIYDVERAYGFVRNGSIRRIRFVVDPSMFTRMPENAAVLVRGFGADAFRAVNCHAKFATVRGDGLAVTIRSSMNLNRNDRIESFDISACSEMTAFFERLVDRIFAKVDAANRSQSAAVFEGLLDARPLKDPKRRNPWAGD